MPYPTCFLNYTCNINNVFDFITSYLTNQLFFFYILLGFATIWVFIKTRSVYTTAIYSFALFVVISITNMTSLKESLLSTQGLVAGIIIIIVIFSAFALTRLRRDL